MIKIDSKAFSEVDAIINCMTMEERKRIPKSFRNYIRNNKDIFYNPDIKEIPKDTKGLNHQTVVLLGIIYEKYFI